MAKLKKVACGVVYQKVFDWGFKRARDTYKKKLTKLCPCIYQEGWLAYLKELGIAPYHPTWVVPPSPIQLSGPLMAYSLILFPSFAEVEYALALIEGEDVHDAPGQGNEDVMGHGIEFAVREVVMAEGIDGVKDEWENHLEE